MINPLWLFHKHLKKITFTAHSWVTNCYCVVTEWVSLKFLHRLPRLSDLSPLHSRILRAHTSLSGWPAHFFTSSSPFSVATGGPKTTACLPNFMLASFCLFYHASPGLVSPVLVHWKVHFLGPHISWLRLVTPNGGAGGRKEARIGNTEQSGRIKSGWSQGISPSSSPSLGCHAWCLGWSWMVQAGSHIWQFVLAVCWVFLHVTSHLSVNMMV